MKGPRREEALARFEELSRFDLSLFRSENSCNS